MPLIKDKLKIDFGVPEYGWLLMNFEWRDFTLDLDLSDVPTDPMEQLSEMLLELFEGNKSPSKVYWHLEPHCYYLNVRNVGQQYLVEVTESDAFDSGPVRRVFEFEGNFEQIILPMYRAVKKFDSYGYEEPHWTRLDQRRIKRLTAHVRK